MNRAAVRLERLLVPRFRPGRPPLVRAIRTALGIAVPLLVFELLGRQDLAVFAAAGGLLTSVADVDATYATKARAMLSTLVLTCVGTAAGTLAQPLGWEAAPLLGVWAFVFAFGVLFDASAVMVGWSATVSFLAGLGLPAVHSVAAVPTRVAGLAIGSAWMVFLALAVWPVNPFRPAMRAVAAFYATLADLLEAACRADPPHADEGTWEERVDTERAAARAALDESAHAIRAARLTRPTTGPVARHLVALHEEGYVLLGDVVTLAETLDGRWQMGPRNPRLRATVADFVDTAVATARAVAAGLDAGGAATSSDLLTTRLAQVREEAGAGTDVSALPALGQRLRHIADALHAAAENTSHLKEPLGAPDVGGDSPALLPTRTHPVHTIRDNLTWESAAFRHALRMGVTMAAAVLLYTLLDIPKPFWITLAVASVVKPDLGGTLDNAVQTVVGTIVGCSLAAILITVVRTEIGVVLLVVPFSMAAITLAYYNNAFFSVGMSPIFVLLSDLSALGSWRLAFLRILNTCIGATLGLVGGYLLWPNSERTAWQNELAGLIRALRTFLDDTMAFYLRPDETAEAAQALRKERRETGIAVANAHATAQRLLNQPGRKRDPARVVITVTTYTERLRDAVVTLASHIEEIRGTDSPVGLTDLISGLDETLDTLARAAETGEPCAAVPDFDTALEPLQEAGDGVVVRELGRVVAAVKGIAAGLGDDAVAAGEKVAVRP
ncbi:MAG: FUSC family protein [Acidimicrobiia bacterium]|nr:FUSC family protein [Acidimicrobiia bacterium]